MKRTPIFWLLLFFSLPGPVYGDEVGEKVEKPVGEAISILQQTQKDEEEWQLLQEKLTSQLDSLQVQVHQLTAIKEELERDVQLTRGRVEKKQRQLDDTRRIEQEMAPFLEKLVQRMSALPDQQLPFLLSERRKRFSRLSATHEDPEIPLSEKYRKTMEALQIEAEFGLTIESSQELIEIDGQDLLTNIFRLGRIGLYFVTLDERKCGFYNLAENTWQLLPNQFIQPLQTAVAIADKRRPVEFIELPLGRMVKK